MLQDNVGDPRSDRNISSNLAMLQAALSPPDKASERVKPAPAKLEADIDEIRTFLKVAFVGIDVEDGYVSLRAFDNAGAGPPDIQWLPFGGGLASAAQAFATEVANRAGARAAVFAPPVCVFGEKRFKGKRLATEDNVIACRVVVLDLDERPQAMLAEAVTILGEPTLLVQSGGLWQGPNGSEPKLHAYWRLSETATSEEDRARLKQVRNGLRRLCAGDATAGPLSHPMRWPGSWHTKGEPRLCKVARRTGRETALDDALERVTRAAADRGIDLSQAPGRRSRDEGFKTPRAHGAVALQALADAMPNSDATPWDEWNTVGMTFYDASHGSAEGLEAFGRWSSKNEKHDPEQVEHRWTHFDRSPPSELSISSLIHRAKAADPAFQLPFDIEAHFDAEAAARQQDESAPSPSTGEAPAAEPVDIFGDASPLELAEPPPGSMPSILEVWARDEARRKGVPVALPAAAGLAVIGAAIGCSLQIRSKLHDDRQEPAALWVNIVADPGSAKSPVIKAAVEPLRQLDRELHRADRPRHDAWAARKKPKAGDVILPEPRIRRHVVDDITMEMQVRVHADNSRGILRAPDEFVGLLGSLGAYKKGAQVDRSLVLRLFDGGPITVDRVSGGNRHADSALMGILAGTQPDVLRTLVRDLGEDGLLQRCLFVMHDGQQREELDEEPDRAAAASYAAAVRTLGAAEYRDGIVRLSDAAYGILEQAQRDIRALGNLPGASKAWQGHVSKWGKILPRIALIFHALEHVALFEGVLPGVKMGPETAERAVLFGRFVLRHSLRFYETFFDARSEMSEAREIAGYILTKPDVERLTRRDIYDTRKNLRGPNFRPLVAAMRELEGAGWCEPVEVGADGPKVWRINPAVHVRFADRAKRERAERTRRRDSLIAAGKSRAEWLSSDKLSTEGR